MVVRVDGRCKAIDRAARTGDYAESIMIRTSTSRLAATFELEAEPDAGSEPIDLTCASTRVWHGRQLRRVIPGPDAGAQLGHRDQKLINLIREALAIDHEIPA